MNSLEEENKKFKQVIHSKVIGDMKYCETCELHYMCSLEKLECPHCKLEHIKRVFHKMMGFITSSACSDCEPIYDRALLMTYHEEGCEFQKAVKEMCEILNREDLLIDECVEQHENDIGVRRLCFQ